MSVNNVGSQILYHKYRQDLNSDILSNRVGGVVETGIYKGMNLLKETNSSVRITASPDLLSVIEISDGNVQEKITFSSDIVLTVDVSTPFIVVRWQYKQSETDIYAEVLTVSRSSILPNDVVVGEVIFVSGSVSTFSYHLRSVPALLRSKVITNSFRVTSTDPVSNKVNISGGSLRTSRKQWSVAPGLSPAFDNGGLQPRYDILYVDVDGAYGIVKGVESSNPVPPDYGNRFVIAEIYRPVSQINVLPNHITQIDPVYVSVQELAMNRLGMGASLIGIYDENNHFTSTTVEDALNEIFNRLISQSASNGASLIGINDSSNHFTSTNVEGALSEIVETLSSTDSGKGASTVGVNDVSNYFASSNVELVLKEIVETLSSTDSGKGASKIGVKDSGGLYTENTVEAVLQTIASRLVGMHAYFPTLNNPGWLLEDGSVISKVAHPEYTLLVDKLKAEANGDVNHPYYHPDSDKARLPNTIGKFIRGIDPNGSIDKDGARKSGSYQADDNKQHNHNITVNSESSHTHDITHTHTASASANDVHHTHTVDLGSHSHDIPIHDNDMFGSSYLEYDCSNGNLRNPLQTSIVNLGTKTSSNESVSHTHVITVEEKSGQSGAGSSHTHTASSANRGSSEVTVKNVVMYPFILYGF